MLRDYLKLSNRPPPLLSGESAVFFAILFFGLEIFVPSLVYSALGSSGEETRLWAEILGLSLVFLLLGCAVYMHPRPPIRQLWGDPKIPLGAAIVALLLAYPLLWVANVIGQQIVFIVWGEITLEQVAVQEVRATFGSPWLFMAMSFVVTFFVPFIEEFFFRGVLLTSLTKWFTPWGAVTIASLCFSLVHFSPDQGPNNIPLLLSLIVLSQFLGYLYLKQGTLWAPIALHSIFNGLNVLGLYLTS